MERRALFLSENQRQSEQISGMLFPIEIQLTQVNSLRRLSKAIKDLAPGVVLIDASNSDKDWLEALQRIRKASSTAQSLITTTHLDVHFWTDALEAGVYDIITQPFHAVEVERLFTGAWRQYERAKIPPAKALTSLRAISATA